MRRRLRFVIHNCIAHPLLVLWPNAGEWLHDRTAPSSSKPLGWAEDAIVSALRFNATMEELSPIRDAAGNRVSWAALADGAEAGDPDCRSFIEDVIGAAVRAVSIRAKRT